MKVSLCVLALVALPLYGCGGASPDTSGFTASSSSSSSSGGSSSSSSGGPIKPHEQALAILEVQRQLFSSFDILEYEVALSARFGNAPPVEVVLRVNEGEVVEIRPSNPENPVVVAMDSPVILTIAESFEEIETAASLGFHQLTVEYDPTYGFPSRVYRDYRSDWHDDQDEWTFTNFMVIR